MTSHGHHSSGTGGPSAKRPIHKDWRLWTAVVLMLAGMAIYVLSDNESLQPGGKTQPSVPAAQ